MRTTALAYCILVAVSVPVACDAGVPRGDLFEIWGKGEDLKSLSNTPPDDWREEPVSAAAGAPASGGAAVLVPDSYLADSDPRVPAPQGSTGPMLRVFAARGEYEPVSFSVLAGTDLTGVSVTPADLRSGDNVFRAQNMDVRRSVYYYAPAGEKTYRPVEMVLATAPADIAANRSQRFWVHFWVPPDQPSGLYRGTLAVSSSNGEIGRIAVRLHVLELTLGPPPRRYGTWYGPVWGWKPRGQDVTRHFAQMREEGLTCVCTCHINPELSFQDGKLEITWRKMDEVMKAFNDAGLDGPVGVDGRWINGWCSELARKLKEAGEDPPSSIDVQGSYKKVAPYEDPLTEKYFREIVSRTLAHAQQAGWPEIWWYPQEEAAWAVGQARYFTPMLNDLGAVSLLVDNGPRFGRDQRLTVGDLWPVRCYNFFTQATRDRVLEEGRALWGFNFGVHRSAYGLYAERVGVEGLWSWAYQWGALWRGWQKGGWHILWPHPSGPIPTPSSVRMREGIDDSRYIALVRDLIERAGRAPGPRVRALAAAVARELEQDVVGRLPLHSQAFRGSYQRANAPGELDAVRARVAHMALILKRALAGRPAAWDPVPLAPPVELPAPLSGRSVALNGDFEQGRPGALPAGWTAREGEAKPPKVCLASEAASSGRMGLAFWVVPDSENAISLGTGVDAPDWLAGSRARFTAAVRVVSGTGSIEIEGWIRDAEGNVSRGPWGRTFIARLRAPTTERMHLVTFPPPDPSEIEDHLGRWVEFGLTTEELDSDCTRVELAVSGTLLGDQPFRFYVDDLRLEELPPRAWDVRPTRSLVLEGERFLALSTEAAAGGKGAVEVGLAEAGQPGRALRTLALPVASMGRPARLPVADLAPGTYILKCMGPGDEEEAREMRYPLSVIPFPGH